MWCPGKELRDLFPYLWSSKLVHAPFKGYSRSQLERMFGDKPEYSQRKHKYAVAYIRVLLSGIELLVTHDLHTKVQDKYTFDLWDFPSLPPPVQLGGCIIEGKFPVAVHSWHHFLKEIRAKNVTMGSIINVANELRDIIDQAYEFNPNKETNLEPINEYVYKVRKEFWD